MVDLSECCRDTCQARILAHIALHQPVAFADMRQVLCLMDLSDLDLCCALEGLIDSGRIEKRVAWVHYRDGDKYLRRTLRPIG